MDLRCAPQVVFVPPFCPNPNCPFHRDLHQPWPWKRSGFFRRRAAPQLPERWAQYYQRAVVTPALERNRRHNLR